MPEFNGHFLPLKNRKFSIFFLLSRGPGSERLYRYRNKCRRSTCQMNKRVSCHTMTKKARVKPYSSKGRKAAASLRAANSLRERDLKASVALKSFFHGKGGKIQRVILDEGYVVLSYLTSFNHILQFYFILVRHLRLSILANLIFLMIQN